jgi:hypothetical protein
MMMIMLFFYSRVQENEDKDRLQGAKKSRGFEKDEVLQNNVSVGKQFQPQRFYNIRG